MSLAFSDDHASIAPKSQRPARPAPNLAWWRGSPVKPGLPVRDAKGDLVGRVTSVAFGAEGEIEVVHVGLSSVFGFNRRNKRFPVERLRVTHACVIACMFRAEIEGLPDSPA